MRSTPGIQILVTVLILAAGLAFGSHDAAANQQGGDLNDRWGNVLALCRLNGGTPITHADDTVKKRVYCSGGYLNGLICDVYDGLTYCYWDGVGKGANASASRHEITTDVQDATIVDVTSDAVTPLTPDVAIQPAEGIESPTVEPVSEPAIAEPATGPALAVPADIPISLEPAPSPTEAPLT